MKFVATKTADQLDLQALHRVRARLVSQRTAIINQIRAFLLERGVAVRQGLHFLRAELPGILATRNNVLSPRMVRIADLLARHRFERAPFNGPGAEAGSARAGAVLLPALSENVSLEEDEVVWGELSGKVDIVKHEGIAQSIADDRVCSNLGRMCDYVSEAFEQS